MTIFGGLRTRWLWVGALVLLMVAVVSCSVSPEKSAPSVPGVAPRPSPVPPPMITAPAPSFRDEGGVSGAPAAVSDRLVIRTATVDIVVDDFPKAADAISALAEGLGGFVVSSQVTEMVPGAVSFVSIRVPAAKLDEALQAIKSLAREVKTLNTNAQDITEEFTDLQARLKNLEAGEAQFLKIMEKANTVEETLQVQRELNNIRGQIESVKGRIKFLEGNVRESLISVTMRLSPEAKPVVTKGWTPSETLRSAARGFIGFVRVLFDILVWLVIFSPVWVAAGLVVIYLRWRLRKARS
jgi:hypothetical protein